MKKVPTTMNVAGSLGCTSNRKDLNTCDKTTASKMPPSTPPAINRNPSPKISLRMSLCFAPVTLLRAHRAAYGQLSTTRGHRQRKHAVDSHPRQYASHH